MLRTFKSYYAKLLLFSSNLKSIVMNAQIISGRIHEKFTTVLIPGDRARHAGERHGTASY